MPLQILCKREKQILRSAQDDSVQRSSLFLIALL